MTNDFDLDSQRSGLNIGRMTGLEGDGTLQDREGSVIDLNGSSKQRAASHVSNSVQMLGN